MNEMVKRVARAIYDNRPGPDGPEIFLDEPWYCCVQAAEAAIEAMRKPTEAMVVAAMITPYPTVEEAGGILPQAREAVRLEWRAMITAALEDPHGPDR